MRSDIRALIVSIVLFGLWGTVLTFPFRLVSDLVTKTSEAIVGKLSLPAIAFAVFVLIIVMGISCLALFLGKKEISEYYAMVFSILACVIYCIDIIQTRSFSINALFVALTVGGTMILVLFHKTEWTRFIADCFVFALPVEMFYECVMNPLYRLIKADIYALKPFIVVPQNSVFSDVGDLLHIPLVVWGGFFFILTLLPVMYLAGGRKEGKIRR